MELALPFEETNESPEFDPENPYIKDIKTIIDYLETREPASSIGEKLRNGFETITAYNLIGDLRILAAEWENEHNQS